MAYQNLEPFSKQLTIVVGLSVVGFMAFGLALSFYRNVLFEQTLANMKIRNDAIRLDIEQGHRNLEYFRSAQFKDKYAKENLGLLKTGEKALILTQAAAEPSAHAVDGPTEEEREERYLDLLRQMPILEHWKLYLFHPGEAEKLREGMIQCLPNDGCGGGI